MSNGPKVRVYTTVPCGYCTMVKTLLDKKGIPYEEKLVFGGTPEWDEMKRATGGARSVPQVIIEGRVVGGYPELLELHKSGRLDSILQLAVGIEGRSSARSDSDSLSKIGA